MLAAKTIGADAAHSASAARSPAESPVVPTTSPVPVAAARRALATVESGAVKSTATSLEANSASRSSPTATPRGSRPASSPASRPTAGSPGRSLAAATRAPARACAVRVSMRPMRPAAPQIPIPTVMAS